MTTDFVKSVLCNPDIASIIFDRKHIPEGYKKADDWTDLNKACELGYLDVIMTMLSNREGKEKVIAEIRNANTAAMGGHLHVIEWFSQNNPDVITFEVMDYAAMNGHLDTLVWLHENQNEGCSKRAMDGAAKNGHLDVVEWLHENRNEGCTVDAVNGAAKNGYLDVIKWLRKNTTEGCTIQAMINAVDNGHLDIIRWLYDNYRVCRDVSKSKISQLKIANILCCNGRLRDIKCVTGDAAAHGDLDTIKWLHKFYPEGFNTRTMEWAAMGGHLHVIRWLHENRDDGCTKFAMEWACGNGRLDIVKWLHENRNDGCGQTAMEMAIIKGHVDVVIWMYENMPHDDLTVNFIFVSYLDLKDILRFMVKHHVNLNKKK